VAKQVEWTADREAEAVSRLKRGGVTVVAYTRQSVSDFDESGHVVGASLAVQAQQCRERPEFAKCKVEVFTDADVSGGEEGKRPAYQQMMARLRSAPAGTIGAVIAYDLSRLHRNTANFFNFMAEMERMGVLVFSVVDGLQRSDDSLSWGVKALVAAQYPKRPGAKSASANAHDARRATC
jgi:DNA invertase Pin-like site-specific DNA recombinase